MPSPSESSRSRCPPIRPRSLQPPRPRYLQPPGRAALPLLCNAANRPSGSRFKIGNTPALQLDTYKLLLVLSHRTLADTEESEEQAIARVEAVPEHAREDEVHVACSLTLPPPLVVLRLPWLALDRDDASAV